VGLFFGRTRCGGGDFDFSGISKTGGERAGRPKRPGRLPPDLAFGGARRTTTGQAPRRMLPKGGARNRGRKPARNRANRPTVITGGGGGAGRGGGRVTFLAGATGPPAGWVSEDFTQETPFEARLPRIGRPRGGTGARGFPVGFFPARYPRKARRGQSGGAGYKARNGMEDRTLASASPWPVKASGRIFLVSSFVFFVLFFFFWFFFAGFRAGFVSDVGSFFARFTGRAATSFGQASWGFPLTRPRDRTLRGGFFLWCSFFFFCWGGRPDWALVFSGGGAAGNLGRGGGFWPRLMPASPANAYPGSRGGDF